jgi:hypothetical protein
MQIRWCTVVVLADAHAREREKGSVRVWSTARLTGVQLGRLGASQG